MKPKSTLEKSKTCRLLGNYLNSEKMAHILIIDNDKTKSSCSFTLKAVSE